MAAMQAGVPICFDGSYRVNLWPACDSDPRAILREIVGEARILIGTHRDISLLMGESFSGDGPERRRAAAQVAFAAFPTLDLIASTARQVENGTVHRNRRRMAASALALAVMKHGLPGDTILATRRELDEFNLLGGDVTSGGSGLAAQRGAIPDRLAQPVRALEAR